MNSLKPLHLLAITAGSMLLLYEIYKNSQYFADISILGGIFLLEIIALCVWKFSERFLVLLIIAFVWAGADVPLSASWSKARWVVLATGAAVGFVLWTKATLKTSGAMHLFAFFCLCAAFVSATVSTLVQMATLKALSLSFLFIYCGSGARLALFGREARFFRRLLLGAEIAVYLTAACYFVFGAAFWGNPNALGAVMSVAVFPILLWGWFTSAESGVKLRRLFALLICVYLIRFSMARAGMLAVFVVTVIFCVCLYQYKLLAKIMVSVLALVVLSGLLAPKDLNTQLNDLKDDLLYKGHKEGGLLGSRQSPWDTSVTTIKAHPWFGTGYGTSPTGDDPVYVGTFHSSAETAREHGSSYITIAEWVGLMGVLPFALLLALTLWNVFKVLIWLRRTADPRHYSVPLAMVVMAGLIHANFEDWLFAVGSYLCLFFWVCAFLLADLVPASAPSRAQIRSPYPSPIPLGVAIPNLPGPPITNRLTNRLINR